MSERMLQPEELAYARGWLDVCWKVPANITHWEVVTGVLEPGRHSDGTGLFCVHVKVVFSDGGYAVGRFTGSYQTLPGRDARSLCDCYIDQMPDSVRIQYPIG